MPLLAFHPRRIHLAVAAAVCLLVAALPGAALARQRDFGSWVCTAR
jgi:hypothetical protein